MSEWTTLVDPELTRGYGVEEIHKADFAPPDWPGKGPAVSLLIPECELQIITRDMRGEPLVFVNRPTVNRNVKYWLRYACKEADSQNAYLSLACDTPEQVEAAVKRIAKWLPHYKRVALERAVFSGPLQ